MGKQIVYIFIIYSGELSTSWFHLWNLISDNGWLSGQTLDFSNLTNQSYVVIEVGGWDF